MSPTLARLGAGNDSGGAPRRRIAKGITESESAILPLRHQVRWVA